MLVMKFMRIRPDKFADLVQFAEGEDNRIKTQVVECESGQSKIVAREVIFVGIVSYKKSQVADRGYLLDVELMMEDGVAYAVQTSNDKFTYFYVPTPKELYTRVLDLLGFDPEALGDNRPLVNKYGEQINSDDALRLWRAMQQKFGKRRI